MGWSRVEVSPSTARACVVANRVSTICIMPCTKPAMSLPLPICRWASAVCPSTGRTYYYRTYAENSEGTAYGRELKFKTPKAGLPDLWAGATSLDDNWYVLSVFGAFYLQDANWIFHQDLGWM